MAMVDTGFYRHPFYDWKMKSQGAEVELRARLKRGSYMAGNYTYQNPEDDASGARLPDVPTHKEIALPPGGILLFPDLLEPHDVGR